MKIYLIIAWTILLNVEVYAQKENGTIRIDVNQESKQISSLIFGQFIEHLGRSIDGGIYDESSPLSDKNGFRTDVMEKVIALHPPILRYPGGTFVKIYHWQDGIGPKSERPKRPNLIWGGISDNHYGTAEFVKYCRAIGAEPFLVVNMATGTPEEASNWVEYCNGTQDTYYANLRRAHGYEEPFNVKLWGIGNEEYAVPDAGKHQNADKYIEDAWQYVKLMKLQSPSIKLTLVGNPEDLNWCRKILKEMNPVFDYLSIHLYAMPVDSNYTSLLQSVSNFNQSIDSMRTLLTNTPAKVTDFPMWYRFPPRQEAVKLAIDEWGIWDMQSGKGRGTYNLEYAYDWSHALAVSQFLNIFCRNSDIIGVATWAQLVNVLAPIMTNATGSFGQTVYTPLQAYRKYTEKSYLPVSIISPSMDKNQKMIDAIASISDDRKKIVLTVLNLSPNVSLPLNLSFDHLTKGTHFTLRERITYTATALNEPNSFNKDVVIEKEEQFNTDSASNSSIDLAPASLNFLIFNLK